MSGYECNAIINSYNDNYKNGWEQVRYLAFLNASLYTSKIKKPQDVMKFGWDNEINEIHQLSKEERQKQEQELLNWMLNFQNNHNK